MEEADKTMILLQTEAKEPVFCRANPTADEERFRCEVYYVVDLNSGTIQEVSNLLNGGVSATMLPSDDSVYLMGGFLSLDLKRITKMYVSNNPTHSFYMGSGCLNLVKNVHGQVSGEWAQVPRLFAEGPIRPSCTVLHGKLYSFGSSFLNPLAFDPVQDLWHALSNPPLPKPLSPSPTVLPDPPRNRILLSLTTPCSDKEPSLFSFTPNSERNPDGYSGTWRCLQPKFVYWSDVAATADNIIFFHDHSCDNLLHAYDLKSNKPIPVSWSTPLSGRDWNISSFRSRAQFPKLLRLSDTSLCLASYCPVQPDYLPDGYFTNVTFFKFTVERGNDIVNLYPQVIHTLKLHNIAHVRHMVPIF